MSTSPMAFPIKNESLQNHCNGTLHTRQLDTSRKPDSYSRKIQENQRAGIEATLPYITAQFHSRVEVHGVDRQIALGQSQGDRAYQSLEAHKSYWLAHFISAVGAIAFVSAVTFVGRPSFVVDLLGD
jgi:hypothetical protein